MTHLVPQWVQNSVKHLKFTWNAWVCVCMCVKQCFKRPKHFNHSISILQFIRGMGQNWGKMSYFLQNYLCQLYLYYFAIVVIINKAFKLFNLVLVVYCDSCCHWWYPGNSAGQKNVYNTLWMPRDTSMSLHWPLSGLWVLICWVFEYWPLSGLWVLTSIRFVRTDLCWVCEYWPLSGLWQY